MNVAVDFQALRLAAEAALGRAYAPYSGFRVSAALWNDDGRVITGVNVENVSYGLTVCAERNALATAVVQNARVITGAVVLCSGPTAITPCGACRQVISELAPNAELRCYGSDGTELRFTASELLPSRFTFEPER
jgi:cytidine deaminase